MKKILSMIMALTMIFSLGTTVFAEDNSTTVSGDNMSTGTEVTVAGNYTAGTSSVVNTYKVTVAWEVTKGSYNAGTTTYTWNPETQKYVASETVTGQSTTSPSVKVTFTNYSDVQMYAGLTYTDTNEDVESSATAINAELPTGVTVTNNDYAKASYSQPDAVEKTMTIEVTDWTKITKTDETLGKVTITVSKDAPAN